MFKTSYRAQLDMISLGAAKANIMISINGFLATVLMISGTFIYASDPLFLPPTIIFLATAAISIFFAIQAASPGHYNKDVQLNKTPVLEDFLNGDANPLIYEHYANLPKADYVKGMESIIKDPDHVYSSMIDYLYWLGISADWSFKMLRYSYLVFRLGILLGITLLIAIQAYVYLVPSAKDTLFVSNQLGQFKEIYLPSGIEPLSDGRLLITEGQQQGAMSIVKLNADGTTQENKLLDAFLLKTLDIQLDEFVGVTVGSGGYVYAITSFSRDEDGFRMPENERIIQFKIDDNRIVEQKVFNKLGDFLKLNKFVDQDSEITIDGLTFDPEGKRLMVAFRQPLIEGKAMLMAINNPLNMFERNSNPRIAKKPVLLDLGGTGIQSISYDSYLKGYLITSVPNTMKGEKNGKLWFWKGTADEAPRRVTLPAMINMQKVQGMSPVKVAGSDRLMIISADGDKARKNPAHFMLLQYEELIFE